MLGSVSERQIKRLFCSEHPQVVLINLNMLKKYIYTHILHWLGIRGNFDFKGKGKNISSFSLEERFNILSLVYKVLHVILGGRVVMNICIKLFQCGNCCILGYLIILKKKKKKNNCSFVWLMSQVKEKAALSFLGFSIASHQHGGVYLSYKKFS